MKKNLQIFLSALCLCAFTYKATAQFSGGNGSENNPYIITTAAQLAQLATYVNAADDNYKYSYYKLGNDIDLSSYQSGTGWTPIGYGSYGGYFCGFFDGNSKKVTGLYINDPNLECVGLFGYLYGGKVTNLAVENVNITGGNYVGGVAGYMKIYYDNFDPYCKVTYCYSTGKISGNEKVGGVVGYCHGSGVRNNYSTCKVSGNKYVGGVSGYVQSSDLCNCYSIGEVNGNEYVGGLSGYADYYHIITDIGSTLENDVALNSSVIGIGANVGRVVGINDRSKLISNAAWDGMLNINGNTTWNNKGASDKDGEDMTLQAIKSDGTLGGRFTAANGWTTQNGKLPGLFGKPVEMPAHLGGVGIDEQLQVTSYELQVYPNPTAGELRVTSDELQVTSMEVFDVYGRKYEIPRFARNDAGNSTLGVASTLRLDISHLPAGIYFLKIETEKGPVTKKVVKQ